MPNKARCASDYYDNDKRYPDYIVKRSHVEELTFHKWPTDKKLAEIWRKRVAKSRSDSFNPAPGAQGTYVCSNHFPQGKQTPSNPKTDYPSVFMTVSNPTSPKSVKEIDYRSGKDHPALNRNANLMLNQKTIRRRFLTPAKKTLLFIYQCGLKS